MKKEFYYNTNNFNWSREQFQVAQEDHLEILDILGFLSNTFFEKQIKEEKSKYYIETFAFKHLFQSIDLNRILIGTLFSSKILKFDSIMFDFPSAFVLQRAILENYLTFYYLYIQPSDENEYVCKWKIYERAGLYSRQRLDIQIQSAQEKLKTEKRKIVELTNEIENNPYFKLLPTQKQKYIINKKPAKIESWLNLFQNSDLQNDVFSKSWQLFSNYAHSEYISLIQFKEYKQNETELLSTKNLLLFTSLVLSAIFIMNIKSLYQEIDNNFKSLSKDQIECIEFFNAIGKTSS